MMARITAASRVNPAIANRTVPKVRWSSGDCGANVASRGRVCSFIFSLRDCLSVHLKCSQKVLHKLHILRVNQICFIVPFLPYAESVEMVSVFASPY